MLPLKKIYPIFILYMWILFSFYVTVLINQDKIFVNVLFKYTILLFGNPLFTNCA